MDPDWYGGGNGWGWFMGIGMIVIWALLIAAAVIAVVTLTRRSRSSDFRPGSSAADLLGERFARGEIDEEEYHRRLEVLERHGAADRR